MLTIRFFRIGKKHQPFYKIVVTDKKNPPRGGRFVEEVGFFNPLTKEKSLKGERIKYWISKGAKASDTVHNLLIKEKILEGKKIDVHKKTKKKKEKTTEKPKVAEKAKPVEEVKPEKVKPEEKKEEPKEEPKGEEKAIPEEKVDKED
jgi:small subunit ribosomal protein S16